MELGLAGKTAVITGGASGLGRETARYLAREGSNILIADLDEARIAPVVEELKGMGIRADGVETDVRDYAACEQMAARARERFDTIDILVASAGVSDSNAFFLETQPQDWDRMLEVNVRGVLNTNRAVGPILAEQRRGSIINLASEAGKVGEKRIAVYSASKGAVISFTKAFALEMGRFEVRVNAVCPGVTMTAMTESYGGPGSERYEAAARLYPLRRLGKPEDIAAMITFLASDESSWITGQSISVSGGFGRS